MADDSWRWEVVLCFFCLCLSPCVYGFGTADINFHMYKYLYMYGFVSTPHVCVCVCTRLGCAFARVQGMMGGVDMVWYSHWQKECVIRQSSIVRRLNAIRELLWKQHDKRPIVPEVFAQHRIFSPYLTTRLYIAPTPHCTSFSFKIRLWNVLYDVVMVVVLVIVIVG